LFIVINVFILLARCSLYN